MTMKEKSHLQTITESLLPDCMNHSNRKALDQLRLFKRANDIYERTQIALGRKVTIKTSVSSSKNVKFHLNAIRSTHQI